MYCPGDSSSNIIIEGNEGKDRQASTATAQKNKKQHVIIPNQTTTHPEKDGRARI